MAQQRAATPTKMILLSLKSKIESHLLVIWEIDLGGVTRSYFHYPPSRVSWHDENQRDVELFHPDYKRNICDYPSSSSLLDYPLSKPPHEWGTQGKFLSGSFSFQQPLWRKGVS